MNYTKYYTLLVLFVLLSVGSTVAQVNFGTGKAYARVDAYGAIRYWTINGTDTIQHINRASVLAAANTNEVIDYYNDLDVDSATELVTSPVNSDYEAKGTYNNAYSGAPPNFLIEQNVYGWNNQNFILVKMKITNKELVATPCTPGLDIIQYMDTTWENDKIYYDTDNKMLVQYQTHWVGIKMLSDVIASAKFMTWYDGYQVDSSYYQWMQPGFTPDTLTTTADGGMGNIAGSQTTLQPNASREVYYAIVGGDSKTDMLANLQLAAQRYNTITAVKRDEKGIPVEFSLEQNYPNPFNPSTTIAFNLPKHSFVSLKVFNILGKEIATVVNGSLEAGTHSFNFDAKNLPSGTYIYTLNANGYTFSKKMLLIK